MKWDDLMIIWYHPNIFHTILTTIKVAADTAEWKITWEDMLYIWGECYTTTYQREIVFLII